MTDLIQKIFAPSYENNSIDSYRSLNSICLFSELAHPSNRAENGSKVLLLAHRDWSTGHIYLEAKKASDMGVLDYIEQFFFGSKSLLNVQKVFKRVMEEVSHKPQPTYVLQNIEDIRTFLNGKITKTYPQEAASIITTIAMNRLSLPSLSDQLIDRIQHSTLEHPGARLSNPGNFCFFNAAMKALWATPLLRSLLENRHRLLYQIGDPEDAPISHLLEHVLSVFEAISIGSPGATQEQISNLTRKLIDEYGYGELLASGRQQDACEFIDRFLQTILPDFSMNYYPIPADLSPGGTTSLDRFVFEKRDVPSLVPIQIARDIDGIRRSKAIIEIPTGLTLPHRVRSQERKITHLLRSVIVHSGTKASSGHYYSFVPNYATVNEHGICSHWTKHDDSSISSVRFYEIKEDLEKNGYLAMYEKLEQA